MTSQYDIGNISCLKHWKFRSTILSRKAEPVLNTMCFSMCFSLHFIWQSMWYPFTDHNYFPWSNSQTRKTSEAFTSYTLICGVLWIFFCFLRKFFPQCISNQVSDVKASEVYCVLHVLFLFVCQAMDFIVGFIKATYFCQNFVSLNRHLGKTFSFIEFYCRWHNGWASLLRRQCNFSLFPFVTHRNPNQWKSDKSWRLPAEKGCRWQRFFTLFT